MAFTDGSTEINAASLNKSKETLNGTTGVRDCAGQFTPDGTAHPTLVGHGGSQVTRNAAGDYTTDLSRAFTIVHAALAGIVTNTTPKLYDVRVIAHTNTSIRIIVFDVATQTNQDVATLNIHFWMTGLV